jgi:2-polyprenyl-3-methyl-5-hydroxy-6-metoxy-1,4-benzoquinol methylase
MMQSVLSEARSRYSDRNRRRKADFAVSFGRALGVKSVLLVGVDRDADGGTSTTTTTNLVERAIMEAFPRVVASGLAESAAGWPEYVSANALELPFDDGEFDLVYSNAVIEHVGQRDEQLQFVNEHGRVGVNWIFTTPNRLFPIESHTLTVVRHMDASWRPVRPAYTRLLSKNDVADLIPEGAKIHGGVVAPTFTVSSN